MCLFILETNLILVCIEVLLEREGLKEKGSKTIKDDAKKKLAKV